jgi:thiamine kinase-like enzyme
MVIHVYWRMRMASNLIVLLHMFVWLRIMIIELWLYIVDFKYLTHGDMAWNLGAICREIKLPYVCLVEWLSHQL